MCRTPIYESSCFHYVFVKVEQAQWMAELASPWNEETCCLLTHEEVKDGHVHDV